MPKHLETLDDHTVDILSSRLSGSSGRFKTVPAGTDRAADVAAAACAEVAAAFEDIGFRWSKSGLRFSRKVGPFTHIVSFQRDRANLSGAHVAVAMHAQVKSKDLASWRDANGVTSGDNVWIRQVGYLQPPHDYLKWQLVDPEARIEEIASMIATVKNLVLPAFEAASSKETLSVRLLDRHEITRTPHWAIDIALWVGNRTSAEAIVRSFLESHSGQVSFFRKHYERELAAPSATKPLREMDSIAWACAKHRLHVPDPV